MSFSWARIEPLGGVSDGAQLLDDPVARPCREHALAIGMLVSRSDDELRPVCARLLVVVEGGLDVRPAVRVVALTDESDLVRPDSLGALGDPLVDVAKPRLGLGRLQLFAFHGVQL